MRVTKTIEYEGIRVGTAAEFLKESPYRLPDDDYFRTINFSGGRSSAYMLHHILNAHGGQLPNSAVVVFCNTGKEREETLDFVQACSEHWSVPVTWLEYDYRADAAGGIKDPKNVHKVVNHETASRNGEPFSKLIRASSILPNVTMRKCTSEMKVRTVERYCARVLGWMRKDVRNVLGIRHDEPRRWQKALLEHCDSEYPMVHARASKADVMAFWSEQSFDLGITSAEGNCDLCFLKGEAQLMRLMRADPDRADWWIEAEEVSLRSWKSRLTKKESAQFSKRYTYRELRDLALNSPELPGIDEPGVECFCTD